MSTKSNKSKPTQLYASISIAIVLFLLGLFLIFFFHTRSLSTILKEKINVVVELGQSSEKQMVMSHLEADDRVLVNSVRFISKEEGLTFMAGENAELFVDENPLKDLIVFNVKSQMYSDENLVLLKQSLTDLSGVESVFYENAVIETIQRNLRYLATFILFAGLVFVGLAIVIVRNTIYLNMSADREEIITLRRIGARWNFIKMPYIKSSVIVGVKGLVMALVALSAVLFGLYFYLPMVGHVLSIGWILLTILLLALAAVSIPALVSNQAANKYLKEK